VWREGAIYRPSDRLRRKKEEALRDLSPELREAVERLMRSQPEEELEKKLDEIIRMKKTRDLIERK